MKTSIQAERTGLMLQSVSAVAVLLQIRWRKEVVVKMHVFQKLEKINAFLLVYLYFCAL